MAPKKGKASKVEVDPLVAEKEAKRKQMIREADSIQKMIQFEEAETSKMQLSKFQLHRNWATDKNKISELQDKIRLKEGQIETVKDQQAAEVMELKKKLKDYLLDLHEEVINESVVGEELNKQAQDMAREVLVGLRSDQRSVKVTQKEREMGNEELVRKIRRDHDRACYEVRRDYERQMKETKEQLVHDDMVTRKRLEAEHKAAVETLEERKLAHTRSVMKDHDKALKAIREYYVDITHNNLEKIKELKGVVAERRNAEEQDLLAIRRLARENKRMAMPLKQANEDLYELGEQLEEHKNEKKALQTVTTTLLMVEDEHKRASWEREILQQKLERAEKEVAALQTKRAEVVRTLDQKNGFERLLLEKRIQATKAEISTREAQMHHVLVDVGKVQTNAVRQITDKPNPLSAKKDHMVALTRHLQTLDETYVNMVDSVKAKLDEFGIAPNEMGFEPRASLLDLS
jgi:hypothetical protein